jgi:L,D-peptidoglycan transpeptidase YkuD (ErfK/YbiS/YcfS/YnhG family)
MPAVLQWFFATLTFFSASPAWSAPPLANARQLVLVTADAWTSTTGSLQRFHRNGQGAPWKLVGAPVEVALGRNGLGWGRGLHGEANGTGPLKSEGDGRAPAGVFALTHLFGYAQTDSLVAKSAKLPYRAATTDLLCVDDVASSDYNRIVDRRQYARPDWKSKEDMRRTDNLYAWGVFVAHNMNPALPQAGSCIFIHVWQDDGVTTSGCTAGPAADIAELFLWLEARDHPVLVQLPQNEYARMKVPWGLP